MPTVSPVMSQAKENSRKTRQKSESYSISGDGVIQVSSSDLLQSQNVKRQIQALRTFLNTKKTQ